MMQKEKINLYEHRDIGALINTTFSFVRQNIKPLMKAQLYINGPVLLLLFLFLGFGQYFLWSNVNTLDSDGVPMYFTPNNNLGLSGLLNVLGMLMVLVFFVMVSIVPLAYMKLYQTSENPFEVPIEPTAVWSETKQKLGSAFGGGILVYIMVVIGAFLCILPGIFLAISFSLFMVTLVLEQNNALDAIKRSYELVKTQWWFSLGLLLVIGIILSVVMSVIYAPFYIFIFVSSILTVNVDDPVASQQALQSTMLWYMLGMYGMLFIMSLLQVSISQTAASFLYGTLIEDKEGVGLVNQIDHVLDQDETANGQKD